MVAGVLRCAGLVPIHPAARGRQYDRTGAGRAGAPLIPLISLLPVTANGLGIAEGAFVLFYTQMGVAPDQAFAAALLRRLLTIATAVPGGLLWLGSGPIRRAGPPA